MDATAPPLPGGQGPVDAAQLDLLGIFHYVVGALLGLFSLFPVLHLLIGLGMMTGRLDGGGDAGAQLAGGFLAGFAALLILLGLAFAGLIAYAGRCLRTRRRYTLCVVVAGLACLAFPFGTVLGIFTLIVLLRPSVRPLFA